MYRRFIPGFVLAALAACWPAPPTRAAEAVRAFEIKVENGAVAPQQRTLKVPHQAEVSIAWSVDRPLMIHLEGYDVTVEARPGRPETMRFKAHITGRFPVHAHETDQGAVRKPTHAHGRALLRLEVHPR
jgi:hypothetical protein